MEEHSHLSLHNQSSLLSEGKFNLEWSQSFRDTIQLENRIKILEIEKQKKIKDIQKKLNLHKRNVELKILKHERHRAVQNMHEKQRMNVTQYFNRFQSQKKKRDDNIKYLRFELTKNKNLEFWSVKKEREDNERRINEQKNQERQEKIKKRNRVRLMEIQAKENVVSSWNKRLNEMKESRQKTIDKKMKQHDENMHQIAKMSRKQRKILQQIYKAQDMQKQLGVMIENQTKMNGQELSQLYTSQS